VTQPARHVLITGANGFIGKNLTLRLGELPGFSVLSFMRGDDLAQLASQVAQADAIVHLAGENRPQDERAFAEVNTELTKALCEAKRC
jgi:UDP-2-acetamido-2,6-beta-L-arabino-hexul-4-ose reductase